MYTVLGQKIAIFRQKEPQNPGKTPKRRETVSTLHVRLDFTVLESPLVPSKATICPRHGPQRRQKAPKSVQCAPTPRNQGRAVSWAPWLKIRFPGHLLHPQPPYFCGFEASKLPVVAGVTAEYTHVCNHVLRTLLATMTPLIVSQVGPTMIRWHAEGIGQWTVTLSSRTGGRAFACPPAPIVVHGAYLRYHVRMNAGAHGMA